MVSVIGVPGASWTLWPLRSLLFFPAVRLGGDVMTQQPLERTSAAGAGDANGSLALRAGQMASPPGSKGLCPVPCVRSDMDLLDTLAAVRRWSVRLGSSHSKNWAGDSVSAPWFVSSVPPQRWPSPLVHHEPLMIGTMNPLSWCFAVLIDLPSQQWCPSEQNRRGHHEPLMVAIMNPLSWRFLY